MFQTAPTEAAAARTLCNPVRVTPTAPSVRPSAGSQSFNVVVHRAAGEPGVSGGHRTSPAPPEDDDLQCADDASSVHQPV